MKPTLITKAEVERQHKFSEKAGMVNMYACPNCRTLVMFLYIDGGITPASIRCNVCGEQAFSQISQIKQPSRIWYRPKNLAELINIVDGAYEENIKEYEDMPENETQIKATILTNYITYYNEGGLFSRPI